MIEESFFQQIIITMLGIIGAIISVILAWYLKKRETGNRIKEQVQIDMSKKVNDIALTLDTHLESAKDVEKRICKRIDNIKKQNKLKE